jgi:hypothetical protein
MRRKRSLLIAILGLVASSLASAAPPCTPVEIIRQRFVDRGARSDIVSDSRGVAVVTGALLDSNSSIATVSDSYLVVGIAGLVLVYPVECGQLCNSPPVVITGCLAGDLIKRLREIDRSE